MYDVSNGSDIFLLLVWHLIYVGCARVTSDFFFVFIIFNYCNGKCRYKTVTFSQFRRRDATERVIYFVYVCTYSSIHRYAGICIYCIHIGIFPLKVFQYESASELIRMGLWRAVKGSINYAEKPHSYLTQ